MKAQRLLLYLLILDLFFIAIHLAFGASGYLGIYDFDTRYNILRITSDNGIPEIF